MEINQDLIMQFGLMQKLSTGNSMLDAILVVLLPMLLSRVLPYLQQLFERFQQRPKANMHRRDITHTYRSNQYFDYDEDVPPNHKLQNAILVHLNELPGFHSRLAAAEVKLVRAPKKKPAQQQAATHVVDGASFDDEDACSASSAESFWYPDWQLESYEINMMPPPDESVTVEPGLTFCRSVRQGTTGEGNSKTDETTITFTLESRSASQIDAFIAAAYDSYRVASKRAYEEKGEEERFLYLPVLDGKEGNFTFRAYPLSDGKDFSNLFHPEKEEILQLVEAFQKKTGKFAIHGYPQKLGFLLHGPPGTGKTSFIKALATHTKRSIINIPLSRIRTNQQLMSLMMDQKIRVEGDEHCRPLPHTKVIYIIEDVDAASHVVQKRGVVDPVGAALFSLKGQAANALPPAAEPADWQVLAAPGGNKEAAAAEALTSPVEAIQATPAVASAVARSRLHGQGDDALNLAGLLNVLDGVVDTPGRLLVMSSNHPEVLDPALIRPGRINRKVYMGRLATAEALEMVAHYFGDVSQQQQEVFIRVWCDDKVSPAALEALCAECDDVDSLLRGVEVLLRHAEALEGSGYELLQEPAAPLVMVRECEESSRSGDDEACAGSVADSQEEGL